MINGGMRCDFRNPNFLVRDVEDDGFILLSQTCQINALSANCAESELLLLLLLLLLLKLIERTNFIKRGIIKGPRLNKKYPGDHSET